MFHVERPPAWARGWQSRAGMALRSAAPAARKWPAMAHSPERACGRTSPGKGWTAPGSMRARWRWQGIAAGWGILSSGPRSLEPSRRNGIRPALREGVAAQEPPHRQPGAEERPVNAHCLLGVLRTARVVAASLWKNWRNKAPVDPEQPQEQECKEAL